MTDRAEIETLLRPLSFYRNKAKNVQVTSRLLVEQYSAQVPQDIEQLVKLPGVARKTATMVLYYAFRIDAGVTVDTHVTHSRRCLYEARSRRTEYSDIRSRLTARAFSSPLPQRSIPVQVRLIGSGTSRLGYD